LHDLVKFFADRSSRRVKIVVAVLIHFEFKFHALKKTTHSELLMDIIYGEVNFAHPVNTHNQCRIMA